MLRIKTGRSVSNNSPNINLTPMLDMVFLILIFFLLTSIIAAKPLLKLDLPRAASARISPDQQELQLVINRDGQIQIDGLTVDLPQLEATLEQKISETPEKTLRISADEVAHFGRFVEVLDIIQKLNLTDLEIVTRPGKIKP